QNEYCALILSTSTGTRYGVVQVAGLIARRIVCRAQQGDRVYAGQRYGLIRFGSRLDLYLPLGTQVDINRGQKVRAGETIIAHLQQ
ncbi:MAG: phosphatidylserine decarboxylase family protein, partial [Desulfocapsa sp.]